MFYVMLIAIARDSGGSAAGSKLWKSLQVVLFALAMRH
jgi:hypothetical protein